MMRAPTDKRNDDGRIVSETELIETYLAPLTRGDPGAFGLRDDAALLSPEPGMDLVVTSDPIIAGVHFIPGGDPADIAWRALAVNDPVNAGHTCFDVEEPRGVNGMLVKIARLIRSNAFVSKRVTPT